MICRDGKWNHTSCYITTNVTTAPSNANVTTNITLLLIRLILLPDLYAMSNKASIFSGDVDNDLNYI